MAKICPVCNEKIGFFETQPQPGFFTHPGCEAKFLQSPEIFGGKAEMAQSVAEADEKTWLGNEKVKKKYERFIKLKRNAKKIDFSLLFVTVFYAIIFMSMERLWGRLFYIRDGFLSGLGSGGETLLSIFTPYILWRVIHHYWLKD